MADVETYIVKYINVLSEFMRQSVRNYKESADSKDLFNLTITQLHYLHAIEELEAPTFKQIVEKFKVQKSTVTDIVNRLIARNLVYKKQSDEDLRIFNLYLTEKGKELLKMESKGYYYFANKMTKCLDEDEKQLFLRLLEKIVKEIK